MDLCAMHFLFLFILLPNPFLYLQCCLRQHFYRHYFLLIHTRCRGQRNVEGGDGICKWGSGQIRRRGIAPTPRDTDLHDPPDKNDHTIVKASVEPETAEASSSKKTGVSRDLLLEGCTCA